MKKPMNKELKEALLSNLVQLGTLILFGFLCGYLLWRNASKEDDELGWAYFLFSVILFTAIGLTIYIVKLIKKIKSIKKKETQNE
ncbi:MAG: hypothetical protein ACI32E_03495 [Bacilli bacterium]